MRPYGIRQLSENIFEYSLVSRARDVVLDTPISFREVFHDILSEFVKHLRQQGFAFQLELDWPPKNIAVYQPYIKSEHGSILVLKPDLFAVTLSDRYEDRWFFEIDLDTESPAKVVEKCEKYHRYYRSGLEQKESEVFPLTVWIVPTAERRDRIIAHIRKNFEKQPMSTPI